ARLCREGSERRSYEVVGSVRAGASRHRGLRGVLVLGIRPVCALCWGSVRSGPDQSPAITDHAAAGPRPAAHPIAKRRSRSTEPVLSPSPCPFLTSRLSHHDKQLTVGQAFDSVPHPPPPPLP